MKSNISLEEVIAFIREHQHISKRRVIAESSLFEKDLGITGDDGCELLEGIEKRFLISFAGKDGSLRDAFCLGENEYLFHSEGWGWLWFIASLFGKNSEKVKALTVGELYRVMSQLKEQENL